MSGKSRKGEYDGKVDPFVKIIKAMLKEPAWLAMSFGARALYTLLKSYYNGENNGRIFLGVRRAAKELGAARASAERWFKELHAHGFISPTQGAFLGADGKGTATHWRLTELGYLGEQPTREFKNWQPPEKKSPHSKKGRTVLTVMTPRPQNKDTCPQNDDALAHSDPQNRPQNEGISTSPYVSPEATPSTNTVTGRSAQSNGAVASPVTSDGIDAEGSPIGVRGAVTARQSDQSHSVLSRARKKSGGSRSRLTRPGNAAAALAQIQARLRGEPIPGAERAGMRASLAAIQEQANGSNVKWAASLLEALEQQVVA